MQKNYDLEMKPAIVGMLADASVKTTDSFMVEDEAGVKPGVPVLPGTNPAKQVKAMTDAGTAVIGIVQHVHKEATNPYYPVGMVVPVVTRGRVWVEVDGDVDAYGATKYDQASGKWSKTAGQDVANAKFITGANSGMAVVQIG